MPIVLGIYEHYKGNQYEVLGLAHHSETHEEMVVYRALYGNFDLWVRPRNLFEDEVIWNGEKKPHFKLISAKK